MSASTDVRKKVSINIAQCFLGHQNEDSIWKTAQELGWVLTCGSMKVCKHCVKAKAKQKNVQRESVNEKTSTPGHRLYLDLSKVTVKSKGTSENTTINHDNWKVMVCEATGKKWSDFTVTKSEMVERTCEHLKKLKLDNIPVRYIQLE